MKPWLKRRKNYKEYNYNITLRKTTENFKEIFQLIKDDIPKAGITLSI